MENVTFIVDNDTNKLTIKVDLKYRGGLSKSGRSVRVASTEGGVDLKDANGVKLKATVNVYTEPVPA